MDPQPEKIILIVEDSLDIQSLLADLLEGEGYAVERANNGREALEHLRAAKKLPGLILLDLMMPEMDGHQFRYEQRAEAQFASIPVVLMTADSNVQVNLPKIGANAFLKKPFLNVDVILETVESFFRK